MDKWHDILQAAEPPPYTAIRDTTGDGWRDGRWDSSLEKSDLDIVYLCKPCISCLPATLCYLRQILASGHYLLRFPMLQPLYLCRESLHLPIL